MSRENAIGFNLRHVQGNILPHKRQKRLADDYETTGDPNILQQLTLSHIGTIYSVASKNKRRFPLMNLDDLMQEAGLGLVLALRRFRKTSARGNTPVLGHVKLRMEASNLRFILHNMRTVHLPHNIWCERVVNCILSGKKRREVQKRAEKNGNSFAKQLKKETKAPSIIEVERIINYLNQPDTLLGQPVERNGGEDGNNEQTLLDTLPDRTTLSAEHTAREHEISKMLEEIIAEIDDQRIKHIIRFRLLDHFGEETLEDIGIYFGISKERIRQLESKAFEILRKKLFARGVRSVSYFV